MVNFILPSRYKIDRKKIRDAVSKILEQKGYSTETILNVIFVGKNKMKTIAAKYKHENVALPVLSFSYQNDSAPINSEKLMGEIFICYPQSVLLASQRNKKVDQTIADLIKHGIENIIK